MAALGAVNLVGESIAALLRSRRSLLAEEGRLDAVPPSQDIAHVSVGKLTGNAPLVGTLAAIGWLWVSMLHRIENEDAARSDLGTTA